MHSIQAMVQASLQIQKSKFLGFLCRVETENEAKSFLSKLKREYSDATHHVYAYILGDEKQIQRASDDKEPQGTAGMPVMDVLQKQDLTDVIAVIVRYYGGIKLGSGGLIRAYSNTAQALIEQAQQVEKKQIDTLTITLSYAELDAALHLLKTESLRLEATYQEKVTLEFDLPHDRVVLLKNGLENALSSKLEFDLKQTVFRY